MKKTVIFLLIIFTGVFANAQKQQLKAAEPLSKKVEVAKEGTVVSFQTNIVAGDLSLTRTYQKGDGSSFEIVYALVKASDPTFNNRKPVRIGLSRKSFDSVFTYVSAETSAKRVILDKWLSEQNISLNEEKGWVALVRRYNNL